MVSFKYLYAGSGRGKSAFYHKYQYIYIGKILSCDIGPYYFRKQNLFHNLPISILFISFVNIFVFHANLYICKNFINFSKKKKRKKFVFFYLNQQDLYSNCTAHIWERMNVFDVVWKEYWLEHVFLDSSYYSHMYTSFPILL